MYRPPEKYITYILLVFTIYISYNTGKGALPDIYAQRASAYTYQAKHECLCYT